MAKFKVGDKVKCIAEHDGNKEIVGKVGTVCTSYDDLYGVVFDEDVSGHSLMGKCTYGYGWNIDVQKLELVTTTNTSKAKIIMFTQGTSVIAKYINDKATVNQAAAHCNPTDTFDVFIGAQLALARLAKTNGSKIVLPKAILKDFEII